MRVLDDSVLVQLWVAKEPGEGYGQQVWSLHDLDYLSSLSLNALEEEPLILLGEVRQRQRGLHQCVRAAQGERVAQGRTLDRHGVYQTDPVRWVRVLIY